MEKTGASPGFVSRQKAERLTEGERVRYNKTALSNRNLHAPVPHRDRGSAS